MSWNAESRPRFVAECFWPNVQRTDVAALDRRLALHASPTAVHVGTVLVPEDEVVFVWFDATLVDDVRRACLEASVPFDRVVAVEGLPAPTVTPQHERG